MHVVHCHISDEQIVVIDDSKVRKIKRFSSWYVTIFQEAIQMGRAIPMFICLAKEGVDLIFIEIHKYVYGSQIGGRDLVSKLLRARY